MVNTEQAAALAGTIGSMKVAVKDERGFVLSQEYGFTVEEENGKVLAFDLVDHNDLGLSLLFGEQVFVLKFWDDEDLEKGLTLVNKALELERERRRNGTR